MRLGRAGRPRRGCFAAAHGAAFTAGLAAWGLERYEAALPFFERAARAESTPALRAAAAFWTARAAVRSRKPQPTQAGAVTVCRGCC